jgi:hypothetical protein
LAALLRDDGWALVLLWLLLYRVLGIVILLLEIGRRVVVKVKVHKAVSRWTERELLGLWLGLVVLVVVHPLLIPLNLDVQIMRISFGGIIKGAGR